MDEVLTEEAVAKNYLHLSVKTLANRRAEGRDHPPFIPGRPVKYLKSSVMEWLRSKQISAVCGS